MAVRFHFKHNEKDITTSWFSEPSPMTAPMLVTQIRLLFPDAEIVTERGNTLESKSPDAGLEELKKLKD